MHEGENSKLRRAAVSPPPSCPQRAPYTSVAQRPLVATDRTGNEIKKKKQSRDIASCRRVRFSAVFIPVRRRSVSAERETTQHAGGGRIVAPVSCVRRGRRTSSVIFDRFICFGFFPPISHAHPRPPYSPTRYRRVSVSPRPWIVCSLGTQNMKVRAARPTCR